MSALHTGPTEMSLGFAETRSRFCRVVFLARREPRSSKAKRIHAPAQTRETSPKYRGARAKPTVTIDYPRLPLHTCRMANAYLLKTEPSEYSFADLQKDKKTVWDGVHNPVALRNLGAMKPGDKLIIYETGDSKSAVGTASVVAVKDPNPKNPQIEISAGTPLTRSVSLAEIKANKLFASSPLVRMGRLSVVPLTAEQFKFLAG